MRINWTMSISLLVILSLGILMVLGVLGLDKNRVTITENCYLPWSTQVMETQMCTKVIYCGTVTKWFNLDDCNRFAKGGLSE